MAVYIALACSPFLIDNLCKTYIEDEERRKNATVFFCGVCIFLVTALRSSTLGSGDAGGYYSNWIKISSMNFADFVSFAVNNRQENGFLFWQWLFSHITSAPQMVFVYSGAIFAFCVCYFIKKNCDDYVIAFTAFITLGLYGFMLNGMRQAIAMSICAVSVEFIKQRKFVRFLLLVLLASAFHQTAIVFIILYFIYGLKINWTSLPVILGCFALLYTYSNVIISWGNYIFDRDFDSVVDGGGYVAVAIYVILILLSIFLAFDKKEEKNYSFFAFMTSLGCGIFLMRYYGVQAAERISYYFMFGQIPLLCRLKESFTEESQGIYKGIVIILMILLYAYRMRTSNLSPYLFFWS